MDYLFFTVGPRNATKCCIILLYVEFEEKEEEEDDASSLDSNTNCFVLQCALTFTMQDTPQQQHAGNKWSIHKPNERETYDRDRFLLRLRHLSEFKNIKCIKVIYDSCILVYKTKYTWFNKEWSKFDTINSWSVLNSTNLTFNSTPPTSDNVVIANSFL